MNFLCILSQFSRKNAFLAFFVALEMILSMLLFISKLGELQFFMYSTDVYSSSDLYDMDYYSPNKRMPADGEDFVNALREIDIENRSKALSIDGISAVADYRAYNTHEEAKYREYLLLSYEERQKYHLPLYSLNAFGDDLLSALKLDVSSGSWFGEWDIPSEAPDTLYAVACGSASTDFDVGDTVSYFIRTREDEKEGVSVKIKIVGKLAFPGYIPNFNFGSTAPDAQSILLPENALVVADSDKLRELLAPVESTSDYTSSFFIKYDPDADKTTISAARSELKKSGSLASGREIIANSREKTDDSMKRTLPLTLFMLVVSAFSMIASVTVTQLKMAADHAVYYICGCPAKSCFMYSGIAVFLLAFITTLSGVIYVAVIKLRRLSDISFGGNAIYNRKTFLILGVFMLLVISVSLFISYTVFKKNSPADAYRAVKV